MKFNEFAESTEFEVPAAQVYPARLVGIYDIGKQPASVFDGKEIKPTNKLIFTYELCGEEKQENGESFQVSEFITMSLHATKATLPKRLKVFGAPIKLKSDDWFDIDPNYNMSIMLGEPCMVEVVHTEKGKAKVNNVLPVMKGLTVPEHSIKLGYLDLDAEDYFDKYNEAPKWIKSNVEKSLTWSAQA